MGAAGHIPGEVEGDTVRSVNQGDCQVSAEANVVFSTVLGSCVSACIRDLAVGVGGMNHFLLATPSEWSRDRYGASARYGAYAMERLINAVLALGSGDKRNLEIKLFGGGLINASIADVGSQNIGFVRQFMLDEGYVAAGEDLGGTWARRVLFRPVTGKAFVKRLASGEGQLVARQEMAQAGARAPAAADDIELF